MKQIIKPNKSIIPSCDFSSLEMLGQLVTETCDIEKIGAYKIGFEIVMKNSLQTVIDAIRDETSLPIIYDHQKAATDIPEMGKNFIRACKGVNAVIFFPFAGIETETAWINFAKEEDMPVIVGGEMTHKGFLFNEGGFIDNNAPKRIYEKAAELGVKDFVLPGNKPDRIVYYRGIIEEKCQKPVYYSPGFLEHGGDINETAKAAGERWHAIVGRGIYMRKDMRKAAKEMVRFINQI